MQHFLHYYENIMITKKIVSIIYSVAVISCVSCNSLAQEETSKKNIDAWLTKADETIKLQKQSSLLSFTTASNSYQNIEVDPSKTYQTIDGIWLS